MKWIKEGRMEKGEMVNERLLQSSSSEIKPESASGLHIQQMFLSVWLPCHTILFYLSIWAHSSPPAFHLRLLKSYFPSTSRTNTTPGHYYPWLEMIPPLPLLIGSWIPPSFLPSTEHFSLPGSSVLWLSNNFGPTNLLSLWTLHLTQILSASVSRPVKRGDVYTALLWGLNPLTGIKHLE